MNVSVVAPVHSKRLPEIVDVNGMVECNGHFLLIVRKPWKLRDEPPDDGALSEAEDHTFTMLSRSPGHSVVIAAGNRYRWLAQYEDGTRTPWSEGSKDCLWRLLLSWMERARNAARSTCGA